MKDFLREYHGELGPLISQFEGTLDQVSGGGIMVFFNDPVPVPNPAERERVFGRARLKIVGGNHLGRRQRIAYDRTQPRFADTIALLAE
jgi:class 3 adenylate cyclase